MNLAFDDGTLLLEDAPDGVPYAEYDDRVDQYRTQARHYRALLEWAGAWEPTARAGGQLNLQQSTVVGQSTSVARAVLGEPAVPPTDRDPDLPQRLGEVLLTALSKEKTDRYDHVVLLRTELASLL